MAPKITPAAVLRQRILSVLSAAESGSVEAAVAKDRLGQQYSWTADDEAPWLGLPDNPPQWQTRANIERNRMAQSGVMDDSVPFMWTLTDLGWSEAGKLKTGDSFAVQRESTRREQLWESLREKGGPEDVPRGLLRELGLYGGASGIFVHQSETKTLSTPNGIAVSLLHTGKSYDDELTPTGLIYHYPNTHRIGHDQSEIEAAKAAYRTGMPVFVIAPGSSTAKRTVHRGYIEDVDDERRVLLVTFTEGELPPPPTPQELDSSFQVTDDDSAGTYSLRRNRPNQVRFAFQVFKRYGEGCAVCDVVVPGLVQAAHLVSKKLSGSDDPRNGLPLCANHHLALDRGYWSIDTETKLHARDGGPSLTDLEITKADLAHLPQKPHVDALTAVWTDWKSV